MDLLRRAYDNPKADSRFPRELYALPFCLSMLGDLSALALYSLGYAFRVPALQHSIHKLMQTLFILNLIGLCGFFSSWFPDPESSGCRTAIFFAFGGFVGDYLSTLLICWLLYRSLVLNSPPLGSTGETIAVCVPFVGFLVFGLVTVGGVGTDPRYGGCWLLEQLGFRALLLGAVIGVVVFANFFFVGSIVHKLYRAPRNMDGMRIAGAAGGIMAANRGGRADTESLSVRLIMYPAIIMVTGGISLGSVTVISYSTVALFIGTFVLLCAGGLNSLAFFFYDPSSKKIAKSIVEMVNAQESERADKYTVIGAEEGGRTHGRGVQKLGQLLRPVLKRIAGMRS